MFWPCETRTSTCRNFATISSGLYRFLAITVLLDVKDIPQVGPLQWGRIRTPRASSLTSRLGARASKDENSGRNEALHMDRTHAPPSGLVPRVRRHRRYSSCLPERV